MANFTTGPATLPDVGTLSYNGCVFSPLFATEMSGKPIQDNANRTIKLMEYSVSVDGYVTLPAGATSINSTMDSLRRLLTARGGSLTYQGRGFDLVVGPVAGGLIAGTARDLAWGPVPELLEFQPLGGGRSAKVKWRVKTHIAEIAGGKPRSRKSRGNKLVPVKDGLLLQFNYETLVGYGEDGYSSLEIRGTLEIPLARNPLQTTRTLPHTADDFRWQVEDRIMDGIDLARFRVAKRNFSVSRDKRVLEWDFSMEERPYMDMPPECTIARGTYSVRPAKVGMGLCLWLCTLRATYTVRADSPRRVAWLAFLTMLKFRMDASWSGFIKKDEQNPRRRFFVRNLIPPPDPFTAPVTFWAALLRSMRKNPSTPESEPVKAWLIDFSFDEGMYLDSKTVTFSATWRLTTMFSHILLASGLWTKLPDTDRDGNNIWATSVRSVSGMQSWLPNRLDPKLDVIVDFGGQ